MTPRTEGLSRRGLLKVAGTGAIGAAVLTGTGMPTPADAATRRIVPRKEWGFDGWVNGAPGPFDPSALTTFVVHYHGASGANVNGVQAPRKVHEIGKGGDDNGSGIRYSFLITLDGTVYQGRGFTHLPGATRGLNEESVAVQMHIHGATQPSAASLASLRWLYRETHRVNRPHLDAALKITGHRDHNPTDCPGEPLTRWVRGPGQKLYRDVAATF